MGLLYVQLIRDIYFLLITGNHQDSLRDAEAAIELNPTFLEAIVRGKDHYVSCVIIIIKKELITLIRIDKLNLVSIDFNLEVKTTLMYI